jgi:hypothetical protein
VFVCRISGDFLRTRKPHAVGVDSLRSNTARADAAICRASAAIALPSLVERQIVLRTTKE